jgi:hypothetical protein
MTDQVEGSLELAVRISLLGRPCERNGVGNRERSGNGSAQADAHERHGRRRGREAETGWEESGGSEGDAALRGTAVWPDVANGDGGARFSQRALPSRGGERTEKGPDRSQAAFGFSQFSRYSTLNLNQSQP